MGKFGCTQIRTSSSCSSEKTKDALISFGGEGWNILPRGLIGLLTKKAKKIFDPFFDPPGEVFGQKMG